MSGKIHPLVTVPQYCFFKTLDHNNRTLFDIRKGAKSIEGYFIVQNTGEIDFTNTFQVSGAGLLGHWFLGRISKDKSLSVNEYRIDVYRRNRVKSPNGSVLCQSIRDSAALVKVLRGLYRDGMRVEHPSDWSVDVSDMFIELGLDVF